MRLIGFLEADGSVIVGDLDERDEQIAALAPLAEFWRDPAAALRARAPRPVVPADTRTLVPPVLPDARVLCVGLNYQAHVDEGSYRSELLPEHPTLFARYPRSLTVDGASVPMPSDEEGMDWEVEVVAWVGRTLVDASPAEALDAVVGYSVFNDLTARRAQKRTSQWTLGKNADHSGALGPLIPAAQVGDLTRGLQLRTLVNGEVMQLASTSQMIYGVGETLAHISRTLTLHPGDLLATGTPSGVGYARTPPRLLTPGDVVVAEVEGLGVVRNVIVDGAARHRSAQRSLLAS